MKPYRRNYIIGLATFIVGLGILLINNNGTIDTIAKIVTAAGFILAGWSGRQWWYYERQANQSD